MHSESILVLVLISVLQFSISFPAVAGDCFDDPLKNNKSYDNCDRCYQTLVNALIDTEDNKYCLARTFFPDHRVKPVQVTVTYLPIEDVADNNHDVKCTTNANCTTDYSNLDTTWYWILGEFYVYQPLEIFSYRSLFFSPPLYRRESVNLYLPRQCFNNSGDFFEYLTQRLRLYASDPSATAKVSDTYVGRAIRASHPELGDKDVTGHVGRGIVPAVYVVPFIAFFIFVIVSLIALCLFECDYIIQKCKTKSEATRLSTLILGTIEFEEGNKVLKEFKNKINNDLQVQGNLAAVCFLCVTFTIYAFCLDMKSIAIENSRKLPMFYHRRSYGFYVITISFTSVSLACDLIGIIWLSVVFVHNLILSRGSNNSCCKKKWEVHIPMLFCIASAILSLSFHFQNILIAWCTDPFYASRIAWFYGIIIFCYFLCVKYAYSLPLKILRKYEDPKKYIHWNTCELITVVISLFVTICVCTGIIYTVATFIIHVPINNSIENSLAGITTLFHGAVILIGGFIAYTVGLKHFGNPFSLEDALKNAMNEIKTTPFDPDDILNWKKLSEEKRMTEVIKALIHRETKEGPPYTSAL